MKGYIVGFKSRASADHQVIDYWFSDSAPDAMRWNLRELAEADVCLFNRGITISCRISQSRKSSQRSSSCLQRDRL